ncbi:DUF4388 domain-containing protein [Geomonas sp. Red32]|uniref:DUF4388 domain-containing protein n=1 Tax=Geomonas sp. Red32 TaxID=2912856 RepID=UPI00202CCECD|nr:DUF4388 domain-containing protein [Geomonas sp. Red32]MCM0080874.1 DUF4388 domain-containing protein [Geomonas sp. Red32]
MTAEDRLQDHADGFVGAMTGVTLADVIQMNGHNRFTGCMTLEYGVRAGSIFFRDGEVIHAEQGDISGEQAFYQIIRWPGGKFHLQPKVTTTAYTIKATLNHLLLEAMRLMDEDNKVPKEAPAPVKAAAPVEKARQSVAGAVSTISGVEYAILVGKDGTSIDDTSFDGETLAAETTFLAMIGNTIGGALALGEVKSAVAHGNGKHLLLFDSKSSYLGVAVEKGSSAVSVENDIRKMFGSKK